MKLKKLTSDEIVVLRRIAHRYERQCLYDLGFFRISSAGDNLKQIWFVKQEHKAQVAKQILTKFV